MTQHEHQVDEEGLRFYSVKSWPSIDLWEIWRFKHLILTFGKRDLKVRYRQTIVGVAWAVIQPLLTMVVFNTLFAFLGRKPAGDAAPYAVSVYCGLLPWQLFASTVTLSTASLVSNQHLVTKVYFPRIILPLSTAVVGLVDFAIAFVILVAMLGWFGVVPSWAVLLTPLFVVLVLLTSLSIGIWLSALNALYRDIGFIVPFLLQIGMFTSPVIYETEAVIPERFQFLFSLNPMVGILDGFRWSLLGTQDPPIQSMLVGLVTASAILAAGIYYFRCVERTLVDRI